MSEHKRLTIYNKLVRDGMPEVISADGHRAAFRTLLETEFRHELGRKLLEEVEEYLKDDSPEELADVFGVVQTLANSLFPGQGLNFIAGLEAQKADERGGFDKRLFLLYVERPEVGEEPTCP